MPKGVYIRKKREKYSFRRTKWHCKVCKKQIRNYRNTMLCRSCWQLGDRNNSKKVREENDIVLLIIDKYMLNEYERRVA